ncbi:hypothetical protein ACFL6Y_05170 [Elusimicrobiota bacterium]
MSGIKMWSYAGIVIGGLISLLIVQNELIPEKYYLISLVVFILVFFYAFRSAGKAIEKKQ